jgi:hypothetical protein
MMMMMMHTLRFASLVATMTVTAACSNSTPPTQPTPTPAPSAQPVTLTLVQGQTADVAPHPVRLAFDAVLEPCNDIIMVAQSCLPSSHPERQFRIAVDGEGFVPLELVRILDEPRFQGQAGRYLVLVERLTVQSPGEWVATVVVRRGLEL